MNTERKLEMAMRVLVEEHFVKRKLSVCSAF